MGEQELEGHGKGGLTLLAADQIRAGEDVAPLVVAAHFDAAAVTTEQLQEIVALHQHVVEFQEGQAFFHALLVALGGQHAVDGEVDADLAQEVDVVQVRQPVRVVDDERLVVGEIQEAAHLLLDALDVVVDVLTGEHLAQLALAGGVAHQAGASAHQRDGTMARALHMRHGHDRDVVTDVQGVRGRIEADIEGDLFAAQHLVKIVLINRLRDEASLAQHIHNVFSHCFVSPFLK